MTALQFYEVDPDYIDYLNEDGGSQMMHNKQAHQKHSRKYIGIVLEIDGLKYVAPLSSFKPKHERMKPSVDMFKVNTLGVINLNNMIPVCDEVIHKVIIRNLKDYKYADLLMEEYRVINKYQDQICSKASRVYEHKLENGNKTRLGKRCPDFKQLEKLCEEYRKQLHEQ